MTMLRISQLAERTGFPATTLRYYETLGLLGPVARQANGYRAYGPEAIARLRFIDRAKRLGVPLEEIAELVEVWSGGDCPPVQSRLYDLVRAKAVEVEEQLGKLAELAGDLDRASAHLEDESATTCGPDCGCARAGDAMSSTEPHRPVDPAGGEGETCSLSAGQLAARQAEWDQLLARATRRLDTPTGARVTFPADPGLVADLVDLVMAERHCCSHLGFSLSWSGSSVVLHVAGSPSVRSPLAW